MKAGTYNNVGINSDGKIISVGILPYDTIVNIGEISYYNISGTSIVISAASDGLTNYVKINPTTTLSDYPDFSSPLNNGRLKYVGVKNSVFSVDCSISVSPAVSNDLFIFAIFKNGEIITASRTIAHLKSSTDIMNLGLHCPVTIKENDYIEVWGANLSGSADFTVFSLQLVAHG